ncbi:uncharacterized protein [Linepithema humile]|uniref:uncharacterized protein n=1 Tax=Linepithema humile TaxID=83485 RepID=UPI00351E05CF
MAQYWVMYRSVRFTGDEHTARFPDTGFIYPKYTSRQSDTLVSSRVRVPTLTSTTTTFRTVALSEKPIKYGFVFSYDNYGLMRHFYKCPHMLYDPSDKTYGVFTVDEYIFCDYNTHTIDVWQRVRKELPLFDAIIYTEKSYKWPKQSAYQVMVHMRWNCSTRRLTSDVQQSVSNSDAIAELYPPGIKVVSTNNTVMLLENDRPKLAMYPDGSKDLSSHFTTEWRGNNYEFVHDHITNQFWLSELCIDRGK